MTQNDGCFNLNYVQGTIRFVRLNSIGRLPASANLVPFRRVFDFITSRLNLVAQGIGLRPILLESRLLAAGGQYLNLFGYHFFYPGLGLPGRQPQPEHPVKVQQGGFFGRIGHLAFDQFPQKWEETAESYMIDGDLTLFDDIRRPPVVYCMRCSPIQIHLLNRS